MKLVMSIISNKDIENVLSAIALEGYFATKTSTTGQFLVDGNTTILVACEDTKVERLYEIIKNTVTKRKIKTHGATSTVDGSLLNKSVDVEEYGAVVFTVDIDNFSKF